jgi:hypothetical protein
VVGSGIVAAALAPFAGGAPIEQLAVGFSFEVLASDRLVFRVPRTSSAADRLAAAVSSTTSR